MTISKKGLLETLSINDIQHNSNVLFESGKHTYPCLIFVSQTRVCLCLAHLLLWIRALHKNIRLVKIYLVGQNTPTYWAKKWNCAT